MQASPVLTLDWRAFVLAGTVNDADLVPFRGLLGSCVTLTACCGPSPWQTPCVAVCDPRLGSLQV